MYVEVVLTDEGQEDEGEYQCIHFPRVCLLASSLACLYDWVLFSPERPEVPNFLRQIRQNLGVFFEWG